MLQDRQVSTAGRSARRGPAALEHLEQRLQNPNQHDVVLNELNAAKADAEKAKKG